MPPNAVAGPVVPGSLLLSAHDLTSIPPHHLPLVEKATERIYAASNGTIIPTSQQLECLAALETHDVPYIAATGSGKTLIIAMYLLMHPECISITVSPLKELQRGQSDDLGEIGIKSLVYNKDTSKQKGFWNEVATLRPYQNFIVQAESFLEKSGHFVQLAATPRFRERVGLFVIDEVHNVDRWGRSHYGVPPFRDAWSKLGSARASLLSTPRTLALTATAPPPMIPNIIESLHLHPARYKLLQKPLNRPNICYAARPLVRSVKHLDNYNFLVPTPTSDLPSTILFCDDKALVVRIAKHLRRRLAPELRDKGLIMAYHGDYSDEYRKKTWGDYKARKCRILIATSSAGTGCNADCTVLVVQAGLCTDMTEYLQKAGRIRSRLGIALLLYEPWAIASPAERQSWLGVAVDKKTSKGKKGGGKGDLSKSTPTARMMKKHRIQPCMLNYVNMINTVGEDGKVVPSICFCRRQHIIAYNGHNESPDVIENGHCCDGPECGLPDGKSVYDLFPIADPGPGEKKKKKKSKTPTTRPAKDQGQLMLRLQGWRSAELDSEGDCALRSVDMVLPDMFLKRVAAVNRTILTYGMVQTICSSWKLPDFRLRSLFDTVQRFDAAADANIRTMQIQRVAVESRQRLNPTPPAPTADSDDTAYIPPSSTKRKSTASRSLDMNDVASSQSSIAAVRSSTRVAAKKARNSGST